MYRKADELLKEIGIGQIQAGQIVGRLSLAEKQLVEIAKAIANESRLIIMDEPTSSLTEAECRQLFKVVRSLREKGVSFIYISHKLDEIFSLTDHEMCIRDRCNNS